MNMLMPQTMVIVSWVHIYHQAYQMAYIKYVNIVLYVNYYTSIKFLLKKQKKIHKDAKKIKGKNEDMNRHKLEKKYNKKGSTKQKKSFFKKRLIKIINSFVK